MGGTAPLAFPNNTINPLWANTLKLESKVLNPTPSKTSFTPLGETLFTVDSKSDYLQTTSHPLASALKCFPSEQVPITL